MNYQTYKKCLFQQLELLLDYLPYGTQEQTEMLLKEIQLIRLKIVQITAYPDPKQEALLFIATIESKINNLQ